MDLIVKKKVLQLLPSPICVVGCKAGDKVHAFGGSWLGQCSFEPPVVWIGVKVGSRPEKFLDSEGIFTLSFLSAEQKKTASVFFKTPPPEDGKFGEIPYTLSPGGAPVLEECLGWLECRTTAKITPGDHAIYYGELVECHLHEEGSILTTLTSGWKYGG
jgi:flavin reductase (DIM6/NTAB) family NADH-FMN oxidoreductase RutF